MTAGPGAVSGFINVYKERGYTSFDVASRLRGILGIKKIGHTGTLDPDAEGVLPVAVGKATRTISLIQDQGKSYEAVALLGMATDTQDISGAVISTGEVRCTGEEIVAAAESFAGGYEQIPPMYSAKKVGGRRLYELAREGKTVEREAVFVEIPSIEIQGIDLPRFTMRVDCGKGTYIRTLINDIGVRLGCGACMEKLLRTFACGFSIEDSVKLQDIEAAAKSGDIMNVVSPVDSVFGKLPKVFCREESFKQAVNGGALCDKDIVDDHALTEGGKESFRVYLSDGRFLGVYRAVDGKLRVQKMLL